MMPSLALHRVHPAARNARFWIQIGLFALAIGLPLGWIVGNYRIGFSDEAEQSIGSAWTLVRLHADAPPVGTYGVFEIDQRVGHGFLPGTWFAKLVVGKPGDLVEVREDQTLVNGLQVAGPLDSIHPIDAPQKFVRTFVLEPGDYFVVGTRKHSLDSRYWGPVHRGQFVGQATLL